MAFISYMAGNRTWRACSEIPDLVASSNPAAVVSSNQAPDAVVSLNPASTAINNATAATTSDIEYVPPDTVVSLGPAATTVTVIPFVDDPVPERSVVPSNQVTVTTINANVGYTCIHCQTAALIARLEVIRQHFARDGYRCLDCPNRDGYQIGDTVIVK